MNRVLDSPELLHQIFTFLRDEKPAKTFLPAASRVNRTWHEIVTQILWWCPPVEALASIKRSRRQLYASHINVLDFEHNRDPTLHCLFQGLKFPMLQNLILGNCDATQDGWASPISHYLTPRLGCLKLYSWDSACSNEFLTQVAEKCPGLQIVELFRVGSQITSDQAMAFLRPLTRLSCLYLGFMHLEGQCQVTGDLLMHLSRLQTLKDLDMGNDLRQPELFEAVEQQNKTPFQCLEHIGLNATSSVISAATRVLFGVESAYFNLLDADGLFLRDLVTMKNLKTVHIATPQDMVFAGKDLLALTALRNLRSITIHPFSDKSNSLFVENFSDLDFDSLVSAWPDLESIEWYMRWEKRTITILSSLSKHCPRLACLTLRGGYDLQMLNNAQGPMFPRLRELTLGNWTVRGTRARLTPLQIARLVDNHAPKLKILRFTRAKASAELVSAWEKL